MKRSLIKDRLSWFFTFRREWKRYKWDLSKLAIFKLALLILNLVSPLLFKMLVDRVMVNRELGALWFVSFGYLGVFIAESLVNYGEIATGNKLTNGLTLTLRRSVWNRYTRMPLERFERLDSGDLKNRIDQDVLTVNKFFKSHVLEYGYGWAFLIFGTIMMFLLSWHLAIFGMLMVPLSFWMTKWLGRGARLASEQYREVYGRYEGWLQNTIRGWKEIKVNGMEKRSTLIFTEFWHKLTNAFFKNHFYWFGNRTFQSVIDFFITRMNLYFVGGLLIFNGELTIGSLLVFMKYYEQFFSQLKKVTDLDMQLVSDIPILEKVKSSLEEPDAFSSKRAKYGSYRSMSNHTIMFDNVSFHYEGMQDPALQTITFFVENGQNVALVGKSGSGKSTIVKLLLGMYMPKAGQIVVGGRNIADIRPIDLHREIAVVMQDPAIFNLSVLDNVRFARPKATDEEIIEACRLAHMDEFVMKLPERYSTMIGERGVQLSGGQKQRLAMARVILSKAPIIILDEATSQLDHESEKEINRVLQQLKGQRSFLIIAHRLSSVMKADRIVLINEGMIEDTGSHEELWQRNHIYRTLFGKPHEVLVAEKTEV